MGMMEENDAILTIQDIVNSDVDKMLQISTIDDLIQEYQHLVEKEKMAPILAQLHTDTLVVLFAMCMGQNITSGFISQHHKQLRELNHVLAFHQECDVYVSIQLFETKEQFVSHVLYKNMLITADERTDEQKSEIFDILRGFRDNPAVSLDDFVTKFDTCMSGMFDDTDCGMAYQDACNRRVMLLWSSIKHASNEYAIAIQKALEQGFSAMTLQASVITIRKKMGLSQKQFAARFGIPLGTLCHWEQGVRKPPTYVVSMLREICNYEFDRKVGDNSGSYFGCR